MLGEHVVVAVVVQHPRFGPVRTRRNDDIGRRESVVADLGELALRLQASTAADGTWRSTRAWVGEYLAGRYER